MGDECIYVVRGKTVEPVDGAALQGPAAASERVVLDLGAGDGRWVYRMARAHPTWLYLALDANAAGMRDAARHAARRPARGGAPNAWFVRAAVEALPAVLEGMADEVHVHLPWGSLLRAVMAPDPEVLRRIARLCRPGASLCVRVNAGLLDDPAVRARLRVPAAGKQTLELRLAAGYTAAGIRITVAYANLDLATSWARRLGAGRPLPLLAVDGRVDAAMGNASRVGSVKMVQIPPARGRR